jgi:hypothetical protein
MIRGLLAFALVTLVALWPPPVRADAAQPQIQVITPQQWRSWNEVAADPRFKALPSDQQELARQQYFRDVIAPRVPTDQIHQAWTRFDADTNPGTWSAAKRGFGDILISSTTTSPGSPTDRIAAAVVLVVVLLVSVVFGWFCWRLWKRLKPLRASGRIPTPSRSVWLVAAFICLAMLVYPPYRRVGHLGAIEGAGYAWLWSPPRGSYLSVDYPLLLTQWVGVLVICGLLWLFLRSR